MTIDNKGENSFVGVNNKNMKDKLARQAINKLIKEISGNDRSSVEFYDYSKNATVCNYSYTNLQKLDNELEKRRVEIIQAEKNMLKRIKELNTITFDRIKSLENFLEVKYSENEKSKHIKKAK